jgi:exonuclease III
MKILTWNCNGAFRKKFSLLNQFNADILIIQECEDPQTSKDKSYQEWAKNYLWIGENKNKGLGIFAKENIALKRLDWDCSITYGSYEATTLKYFISCTVNDDFTLLGAWCHGADSPTFGYIGQLWQYLQKHKTKLTKTIIAGDFNSNGIWDRNDRWWNHSDVVRELKELKIESTYHYFYKDEPGKESRPTFFLQRNNGKMYHIDYVFASEEYLKSLKGIEIGKIEDWIKTSDHMPILCEF